MTGTGLAQVKAAQALQSVGVTQPGPLRRVPSVSNDVWMSDEHVVRLSGAPHGRLHREARLVRDLPPEVRYPRPLGAGTSSGVDYLVLERVPGVPLSHRWPDLTETQRREAIRDVASILRALHSTPAPRDLVPLRDPPQPIGIGDGRPTDPVLELLDRACQLDHVDQLLLREAGELIEQHGNAFLTFPTDRLIHGDLAFENLLWDGRVTALIDLEYARGAPPDLDLDMILRCCAHPSLFVAEEHEARALPGDYAPVPEWLAEDHPGLFAHPQLHWRLRIAAIGFSARELLSYPPTVDASRLPEGHPMNSIKSVLAETSYLDRLSVLR